MLCVGSGKERKRKRKRRREGKNVLAAQTSPWTEREGLASLLDVLTILVDPSLGLEGKRFMPVLFGVRHRPSASVHFRLVDKVSLVQGQQQRT